MNQDMIKKRIEKLDLYDDILKFDKMGDRLVYLRKHYKNISAQEFSKTLNIARSYVYLCEKNDAFLKPETLQRVADFYDIDINILDSKRSISLSLNEYDIIHQIADDLWCETSINKNSNITKFEFSKMTISICDALLFIISILKNDNKKEFYEYFVNSLLVDTKDLKADEESIIAYLNNLKKKAMNVEDISIHLDYLFRSIEKAIYLKSFDQKTFNFLLRYLLDIIEILFL